MTDLSQYRILNFMSIQNSISKGLLFHNYVCTEKHCVKALVKYFQLNKILNINLLLKFL